MAHDRRWRRFSGREFNIDATDFVDSIQDVIDAAMDAGMETFYAFNERFGDKDCSSWKPDEVWSEARSSARAFAGRFATHPSWRSAWERTSRGWSDTN